MISPPPRYEFASDNTAGLAPEALQAVIAENTGFSAAYGRDDTTRKAADLLRALLDTDAEVHFVGSGTAANGVALSCLCRPFESVLAYEGAHIRTDEAGAPSFFGGGLALSGLPGRSGRVRASALEAALARPDGAHLQSPAALSLANATEYGAVYDADELTELVGLARKHGVRVHLDGARLANAVAAGFDPKRLSTLGLDVLVVGAAKAGGATSEAVVLFDRSLARRFDARLKQAGHLPAKSRFLTAPWLGLLTDNAWVRHAGHANEMARRLAAALPFRPIHPVQTNAVFIRPPDHVQLALRRRGWIAYPFPDGTIRLMCSWATTEEMIDELASDIKEAA